jgi:ankyrin repeat protein
LLVNAELVEIYPGDTPDIKALKTFYNDVDVDGFIRYFHEHKLPPDFVDEHGRGIFHWWALTDLKAAGLTPPDLVQTLTNISAHPDVNYNMQDDQGNTQLHYFAMTDKALALKIHLGRGADPSLENNDGKTPLHIASELGFDSIIQLIVTTPIFKQSPLDILYQTDNNDYTALHYAAEKNQIHVVENLLDGIPSDGSPENYITYVENPEIPSPFHLAIRSNSVDVVKLFLKVAKTDSKLLQTDPNDFSPLQSAIAYGHEQIAQLLLTRFKRDPTSLILQQDNLGRTAIHHAARFGRTGILESMMKYIPDKDKEEVLNQAAKNGWTPLHYAARYHQSDTVSVILAFIRDDKLALNAKISQGYTALQLAAHFCELDSTAKVMSLLVEAGADKNLVGPKGFTAFSLCQRKSCTACVAITRV